MAERFSGKYSPGGTSKTPPPPQQRRRRAGARVNLLFIVPGILVLTAFQQEPVGMALDLAGFGTLILAAWLTREGLRAEDAYEVRRVAKRPAIPRKIFASVLTGIGLAIAGLDPATFYPPNPLLFALLGAGLHFMAFGPDPLKDKGVPEGSAFQTDRVAKAVDEAERHLTAMREAIRGAGVPSLSRRVDRFSETARQMFRVVEDDPRDLTGARRYLGVYLLGARDATSRFADLYSRNKDESARTDYEALLDDLETTFAARTDKMLLDDKSSLDVEIEVLRDRLAREGVNRN
ncbi:5-bromo-4-chloroindolyl phosphate hydrolysis family protein [Boseongicola aestuarii]|uniref:5-bromo-4-chloroindolyl phosphate hydrolysis protein n=1 Tax=Boseongicola aestuarii TaxID=1470561 RepID=A0A238IZQ8_9RHOB|nr:5-bromo-4-chloroindolyl phosphate hydrolysis family protein [Boseongicola aestuarii]SMX23482.1 5-bromo-4-chloroindolyl phosphate hydrolysis protein [Boseongicola aestuarii]